MSIKEPLRTILKKYFHIECYNPHLTNQIFGAGKGFPYNAELFKYQLREAIDNRLISPEEYEALTEEDFDSQEDLQVWLEELWEELT